jgi:thiol:disulfide interchange protein
MAGVWLTVLIAGFGLVMVGMALWLLVLPPGKHRRVGGMHYALWSILACGLALLVAAVPCGFARDIEMRTATPTL